VDGTAHAKINGGQTSFVSPYQQTFVRGSRSAEVFGNDFALVVGAKESIVVGGNMSVVVGADMKIVLAAQMDVTYGPHASFHSATKLELEVTKLGTKVLDLENAVATIKQFDLAVARTMSHIEQKSDWIVISSLTLLG
jgi:hypothetical protein